MPSYDWSQTPGGSISVGANTITLTPCPASVDGTNSDHYVYLSGGTGTAEYVLITGGTCTSGAATGTIEFTAANTHTGAWTASSASDGLQESLYSVADGAKVAVVVPEGSYNIYATVSAGTRPVTVACTSLGAIFSAKSNSITLLDSRSGTGPQVSNCTFRNDDSLTGVTAIYSNSADGPSSGGAFAGRIENNWFVNFDKAIHSVTTNGWHIVGNHIISSPGYNATAAIHTEALTNGDQGTGLIAGNIMTCSATCTYGLLWNGPGALQLKHNNLNGYTTQVHLQPAFGTASATGSTVTWQSGNKFRTNWAGTTIYLGSTARTIASVDSDTQITTSTAIGTVSTTDYYINQSSQVSIMSNNFDAGTNTQYGVRWTGAVTFQNAQIEGNFFSNWSAVNNHQAITIESGTNLNFLGIRNNHIQSSGGTAVYGIRVKSGYGYAVENNQVAGSTTGVSLETTSLYPKASGNQCILIGTACLASTDATAEIMESQSVTYAELAALSAASGSRVYCSNCSAVCATAGTGAIASRVNGSWVCSDGTSSRWTLSGSNIYRASQVGIGAAPVSTAALSISGGSGANEVYIADASGTTAVQLIAENTYGVLGTYTNHEFHVVTDSNGRWTFGSNGMFKPFLDDMYDIGLTGTRVRGVYAKFGEFYKAGSTSASDYVETRKYKVKDATGSAGSWDMQADITATVSQTFTRDNVGDPFRYSVRQSSGSPVNYEVLYASLIPEKRNTGLGHTVTDSTFPKLGTSSQPWSEIWGTNGDFAGDMTVDGTTVANVLNYASGTMAGTMKPLFGGTGSIGASGYSYGAAFFTASGFTLTDTTTVGYVWTATSTGGAGSWQAASGGLPVVDTTGIANGSSDATKIVRFEVDGFTTGTTRTLTPQNNSYTIAGINIAQTFSATQTHSADIASSSANANSIGSGATPFGYMAAQYMSAEQHRIVNPGSSHGTYWDWRLQSAGAIRLYSGTGTQIEMDISVISSTNTQFGIRGSIYPTSTSGSNGDIGYSGAPWRSQYLSTSAYMNGTQWMDSSRNLTNLGTGTFSGAITANGGIATGSATNSTLYVGSGNLYLRTYSGANPSCPGITNGWVGYRTDTNELQICSGGNLKVVGLL
jgi:hypothetical protein